MQPLFHEWKYGQRHFAQGFGREQAGLGLLVLQQCLKDRKGLPVGGGTQGLGNSGPNRRIRMPRQIGGHQHRRLIAQS
jgi:hypothetical protein